MFTHAGWLQDREAMARLLADPDAEVARLRAAVPVPAVPLSAEQAAALDTLREASAALTREWLAVYGPTPDALAALGRMLETRGIG